MFELQLLRRPLSPKTEPEQYIPKRKSAKSVREKEKEYGEVLGDVDSQPPLPEKSQPITLCFPDYDFGVQVPSSLKRNFVIPACLSGPPCFPMQNRRTPIRLRLPALRAYTFQLPQDFIVSGVNMGVSSLRSVIPKSVPKKPLYISHYNYEVFSSHLIAKEIKGPEKMGTIFLKLSTPDRKLLRQEKSKMSVLEEQRIILDGKQIVLAAEKKMRKEEKGMRKKSKSHEEVKQEMDFPESFVSGVGYKSELTSVDTGNELLEKAEMVALFCIMHRKTGLSLKLTKSYVLLSYLFLVTLILLTRHGGFLRYNAKLPVVDLDLWKPEFKTKAHFLSRLPDLLPLSDFLLYLNLSYNNLDCFPPVVFQLKCLEALKLRNNPIKFIPGEISAMRNLKFLIMPFNLLTTLPPELFALPNLQRLDVSYNELEYIPTEIQNLRNLTYLNVEGNLLYSLPCGILKLQLSQLLVENNFLHACFWNEIFLMQPQRLTDMATLCFVKHRLWKIYHQIPQEIQNIISNFGGCDCCRGPLYGKGFRFILIYRNVHGLRLPYQFSACSPVCYMAYVTAMQTG